MTIAANRSFFDVMIGEPLELAKSQPHQILLSTGSVALMGQFAATDGIVSAPVGYLIAIGVEWAYLRGLASDSRAQTGWGSVLNWSAFGIVVLWGVLWCAGLFGAFDPSAGGWWLAAAHVVPVAWLSLCSAQCHRAAMAEERKQITKDDAARRAWELAQLEEDKKLERWKEAQRVKSELKIAEKSADATMRPASAKMQKDALPVSMNAEPQNCPKCGAHIENRSAWLAARRWNRCAACKEVTP
jgi:hypothetical protein